MTLVTSTERLATRRELQALIRRIEQQPTRRRPAAASAEAPQPLLEWRETPEGRVGYRELRYDAGTVVGTQPLAPLFDLDVRTLHLVSRGNPEVARPGTEAGDLVFFDIETTGLGGAGAAVFMFATARAHDGVLTLRQYVSPSPADEPALLSALLDELALPDDPVLTTYNGLTFDAPFTDERATLHRRRAGLQSARHLDLLHTVRRGYRGVLPSHRLGAVEGGVLNLARPEFEVGGGDVPAWYFRFMRSGSLRYLEPLLDHNARDVLSLAALVAHLHEGVSGADAPHAERSLALGRLALAARAHEEATRHLRAAIGDGLRLSAREDAVRDLVLASRALGRRDLVVDELEWLIEHSPAYATWARHQLAIYYEHVTRDITRALALMEATDERRRLSDAAWSKRHDRLQRKALRGVPATPRNARMASCAP
ncbi:MAG: ribonuclease H-like domain-containing protein [Dehalococcoidia bacterium]